METSNPQLVADQVQELVQELLTCRQHLKNYISQHKRGHPGHFLMSIMVEWVRELLAKEGSLTEKEHLIEELRSALGADSYDATHKLFAARSSIRFLTAGELIFDRTTYPCLKGLQEQVETLVKSADTMHNNLLELQQLLPDILRKLRAHGENEAADKLADWAVCKKAFCVEAVENFLDQRTPPTKLSIDRKEGCFVRLRGGAIVGPLESRSHFGGDNKPSIEGWATYGHTDGKGTFVIMSWDHEGKATRPSNIPHNLCDIIEVVNVKVSS